MILGSGFVFFCSDIFDWFTFGKMIQSDFHIFQMGWKSQLMVNWVLWKTLGSPKMIDGLSRLGKYPIRGPRTTGPWALDLVLENHQVLVASHNRHSIERTIQKMAELGVSQVGVDGRIGAPKRWVVFFG